MDIMDHGASGAHAVKHAKKDSNQEHVNAIHLLLSTVEWIAQEIQMKTKFATDTFRAQVFARFWRIIYAVQRLKIDDMPCTVHLVPSILIRQSKT